MSLVGIEIKNATQLSLPLYASPVPCGFPSPADDFVENQLDLNEKLIQHPASTFFVRAKGDSMIDAGIRSGDILIIDKSLEPKQNSIVLACIDGEFTIKKFLKEGSRVTLYPCNDKFKPIDVTNIEGFSVEGLVTFVIHEAKAMSS